MKYPRFNYCITQLWLIRRFCVVSFRFSPVKGNSTLFELKFTLRWTPSNDKIVTKDNIDTPYLKLRTDVSTVETETISVCLFLC